MLRRNVYTVHRVYFGHIQIHIVGVSVFLPMSNDQSNVGLDIVSL